MHRGLPIFVFVIGACGRAEVSPPTAPDRVERDVVESNVLRGDYVGSEECSLCHADIHAAWRDSPMRNMTRSAAGAEIRAPANGRFELEGDIARMHTDGRDRFVTLNTRRDGETTYRVSKVIGGRFREDFVGIDIDRGGEERVLPVSFVYSNEQWRYKGYSVLVPARDRLRAGPVWRKTCILCHNTAPYQLYLYDDLLGDRMGGYQGSMANDVMEAEHRWRPEILREDVLRDAITTEIGLLGGQASATTTRGLLRQGIESMRARFGEEHLLELGIGCEACHNGSREHAEEPSIRPSFEARGPIRETWGPPVHRPGRAEAINRTCMRCHTVLFSRYAHTWEGGHRYRAPGGSPMNSGEARDFWLGGCAEQLTCTACHDPHEKDDPEQMKSLASIAGNEVCTPCHSKLADPAALGSHTRHDPKREGSACVGCHMPRKNLGLEYRLTRYHRIGAPTERRRVEGDRPLECALCHADHSTRALVESMERWWGKRYDREALRRLYGDLEEPPLVATLRRGKPHEQAVAAAALGETGDESHATSIAPILRHRYPLVRFFAAQALEDLLGEWPQQDLNAHSPQP